MGRNENFPKTCGCGAVYRTVSWRKLPFVGFGGDDVEALELRNCVCGSTIAIVLPFWDRVQRGDGCWIWQGAISSSGYGRIDLRYTHRIAYAVMRGPIPEGMFVCHTCDVPTCVRPDHLFVGSAADNLRDMLSKGRGVGCRAFGELGGGAKLTIEQVRDIRRRYTGMRGEKAALSREYGVSDTTIGHILGGHTWTEALAMYADTIPVPALEASEAMS
jgi:hypothetical protein